MTKAQHYSHTISVAFVNSLVAAVTKLGIDAPPLLHKAGISPLLLNQPRVRISPEQYSRLVRLMWQATGEETLGMASPRSQYGVFTLVAKQLLSCKNLEEVLTRGCQLYNMLTDGFRMTFQTDAGTFHEGQQRNPVASFTIEMSEPSLDPNHLNLEFLLIIWLRFPGWMVGQPIPLKEVHFRHSAPKHADELRFLLPAPCRYNQPHNRLIFENHCLKAPVVATSRGLRLHLARAPLDWFIREPFHPMVTSDVMRILNRSPLQQLPKIDSVAASLGISVRSLRRKLKQEGNGFQRLKDNYRRDQAIRLLSSGQHNIAEIGQRLGFEETSSFIRSFKQWTGVPPGTYRKHRLD